MPPPSTNGGAPFREGANANLLADIKRINPQSYNHDAAVFSALTFFRDARLNAISQPFRGRVFPTLRNNRAGRGADIIPDQGATDLISSTSVPRRSILRVVAKNVPDGTVMIRSDTVALFAWPQSMPIGIDSQGDLIVIGGAHSSDWTFDFEDFGTGRFVDSDRGIVYENVADNAPKTPGWELVN
ncbi:hypothetical protein CCMSSC00406_0004790 [Pleurotus cornucopiae]|uniref:Uncharacterized protein n=1 Tax=Pleurotus cornucopiae TaxID=5321 RepID=A0ACB7J2E7_PLECO|nr:hypothetical protein CCMSSC00406_0004790 [Pleurotus cornucopiae]